MAKNKKVENLTPDTSTFTGGAFANFFRGLLSGFVTLITFGLAYPAMVCWRMRWEASHTYINGRRLVFDGKARQLFGNYIKWVLLSIITLGIYFIVKGKLLITEWQTKHTHFEGMDTSNENNQSRFDGKWYQLFGVNFVSNLVTVITLTIGSYWAHCYRERWYAKHKTIDGHALYFNGTAMQYFGKRILWTLLTIVTLGIYAFWLIVKTKKWTISHTFAEDPETLPAVSVIVPVVKPPKNKWAIAGFVCSVFLGLGALGMTVCYTILADFVLTENTSIYVVIYMPILALLLVAVFFVFDLIGYKHRAIYDGRGKKLAKCGMGFAIFYFVVILVVFIAAWNVLNFDRILKLDKIENCSHENAVYTQLKESTCTEEGNVGYWYCKDCDGYKLMHKWEFGIIYEREEYESDWYPYSDDYYSVTIPAYHNYFEKDGKLSLYCKNCGLRKIDEFENELTYDEFLNSNNALKEYGYRIFYCNYDQIINALTPQLRERFPAFSKVELYFRGLSFNFSDANHDNKVEQMQVTFVVDLDTGERAIILATLALDPVDIRYVTSPIQSIIINDEISWSNYYTINFTGVVIDIQTQILFTFDENLQTDERDNMSDILSEFKSILKPSDYAINFCYAETESDDKNYRKFNVFESNHDGYVVYTVTVKAGNSSESDLIDNLNSFFGHSVEKGTLIPYDGDYICGNSYWHDLNETDSNNFYELEDDYYYVLGVLR